MIVSQQLFGGLTINVLLAQANWEASALSISHDFASGVTTGKTSQECRVPAAEALVLGVAMSVTFATGTEAQEWRDTVARVGTGWIGVPLWRDMFLGSAAATAQRVYAPQVFVDVSTGQILAASASLAPNGMYCPLVVGHMHELSEIKPLGAEDAAEVELVMLEDSPWDFRIGIAAAVGSTAWPADLRPDLTEDPVEIPLSAVKYERLGFLREHVQLHEDAAFAWSSKASFTLNGAAEIATLLAFFSACRGSWQAFSCPFWYTPGIATADAPHASKMRFAKSTLTIDYETPDIATATIELVELPWEIVELEDKQPMAPPRVFLYRIKYAVAVDPVVFLLTNCWRPLAKSGHGTYSPAPLEHEALRGGTDLSNETVTLTSTRFPGNPLDLFGAGLEAPLELEIYEIESDPLNPDAAQLVWAGTISGRTPGEKYTVTCKFLGGVLDQEGPNVRVGYKCNTFFGSARCGHDRVAMTKTGTLTSSVDTTLIVAIADSSPENTYANGVIHAGSGLTWESRTIIASKPVGANQQFTIDRPLRYAGYGATMRFYRSCNRLKDTCKALDPAGWRNRFSGFPNLPLYALSMPAAPSAGGGKK